MKSTVAAPAAARILVKTALLSGLATALIPGIVLADPIPKSGTTSYTTHFVFVPKSTVDIPGVGPLVLPVRNRNYTSGLKPSHRGVPVFISRGIGCTLYPLRFNCLPEIAVLELVPDPGRTSRLT